MLESSGKTGYWSLRDAADSEKERLPKVRQVIDSFLREHDGKAYLADVVAHVSSVGLKYSDSSIRTYLSSMCHVVRDQIDLFVHNDFLDLYPSFVYASKVKNQAQSVLPILFAYLAEHDGRSRMRELIEEYRRVTGNSLRDTTLRAMIANASGILSVETINKRDIEITLLVPPKEATKLLDEIVASKKPKYYGLILNKTKEIILSSPYGFVPVKKVFDEVVQFVPENRRTNIVYKLLQNSPEFETYIVDKKRYIRMTKATIKED